MMKGIAPICPYCGAFSVLVTGAMIYPHRHDLAGLNFYQCAPCAAHVGCHKTGDGKTPLGRLANAELRKAKSAAHAAFDPIWQARAEGSLSTNRVRIRNRCYEQLAKLLGIAREDCHIGMMDVAMCQRVFDICKNGQLSVVSA